MPSALTVPPVARNVTLTPTDILELSETAHEERQGRVVLVEGLRRTVEGNGRRDGVATCCCGFIETRNTHTGMMAKRRASLNVYVT
jgi:hypothetical protein